MTTPLRDEVARAADRADRLAARLRCPNPAVVFAEHLARYLARYLAAFDEASGTAAGDDAAAIEVMDNAEAAAVLLSVLRVQVTSLSRAAEAIVADTASIRERLLASRASEADDE